ncbi:terminase large subunit [Caulobacter sp.]|uniref:terminase large subunit n=1 Tax=Caulobacter sp. TaxID=78 RepID=UPI003BB01F4C
MAAKRKWAEPAKPKALARYKDAWWDADTGVWRDGEYWYDEGTADKAAAFFPNYLRLTTGEWAGRPFVLQEWQEHDIIRPLFGWKRPDGTRRYRVCYVWVPRKNGKTELAAGIALLMLLGDAEPAGQVFSIASEKDQAAIVFDKATSMVAYSPSLSQKLECMKPAIYCPQLNASFRPLSGKPGGKHGLNMSGLIGDEIHEWRNGDLYTFIHDSGVARRQPLEFLISTAGVSGSHGETVWSECQAILKGEVEAPHTLVVVYAADPEADWTKPEVWAQANPNLGVSVKVEAMAEAAAEAKRSPRLENDFKRYKLNIWTEQAVRWLPIDGVDDDGNRFGWDHCVGPVDWRALEDKLAGKRCFGGLDLSAVQDLSALVWWFPEQEGLDVPAVLARFWKPADLIKEHTKRDRVPYDKMLAGSKDPLLAGSLLTTPGNVIDHEAIRARLMLDAQKFKVAFRGEKRTEQQFGIAIDRFDASETYVKLHGEGLPVGLFGQGFVSMSAPAKDIERFVLGNAFHHGGQPLLRRHAQAVAIETDAAGNIKPSKDKSTMRIDGIVGLVMARGAAAKDTRPKVSVYESRGIRRL